MADIELCRQTLAAPQIVVKRVLLVAYHFPPQPAAGSQRLGYLARYLPEFGWRPTVLTRQWPGDPHIDCSTVRAPAWFGPAVPVAGGEQQPDRTSRASRLTPRFVKEAVAFPDRAAGWLLPAIGAALRATGRERFDAIVSSSYPPTAHVVGGIVARMRRLPWLADYRDPWHGNRYVVRSPLRENIEKGLERRLLRRAAVISTVSPDIARHLESLHGRSGVAVIPNAVDPADWDSVPGAVPARFGLCYTGILYQGKRRADILLDAIAQLRAAGDPAGNAAHFDVYGPDGDALLDAVATRGLEDAVDIHGLVPRQDALRAQRASAALIILLNMDSSTAGELGSKVFEYAGARRPIIAVGPRESVMRPFLERSGLGWFAADAVECTSALRNAYAMFTAGHYEAAVRSDFTMPTARGLAKEFAALLDGMGPSV